MASSLVVAANAAQTKTETPAASGNVSLISVEAIPHTTEVIEVDTLPADVESVKQEGVDGVLHVYGTRGYTESGPVRSEIVVQQEVPRIIERGTKLDLPVAEEPEVEEEPEPEAVADEGDAASRAETYNASTAGAYSLGDLMFQGVIHWGGYKFTYYSQSVLPGPGLAIPGRHVSSAGFVSDGSGNVVLAAGRGVPHGTTFSIPFGSGVGKVYDTCGSCSPTWLDVYTR